MKNKLRVFSAEQKMQILRDSEKMSIAAICRKYEITHSLYYRWKSQFDAHGIEGLQGKRLPQKDPKVKELERENERLKKINI